MTQGEAVFQAVLAVFGNDEGMLEGAVPETKHWSDEQKKQVHGRIFGMFKNGTLAKNSGGNDDAALLKYIPGLTNNWVRKDLRLNGGVKYTSKNPGSRTGGGDDTLKNMKILLKHFEGNIEAQKEIQAAIDARIEELKPKETLDVSKIPAALMHLIGK